MELPLAVGSGHRSPGPPRRPVLTERRDRGPVWRPGDRKDDLRARSRVRPRCIAARGVEGSGHGAGDGASTMKVVWAPWRMAYIKQARKPARCIFCSKARERRDAANLLLHRGRHGFVIMNLFPYNSGHLMVAPYA